MERIGLDGQEAGGLDRPQRLLCRVCLDIRNYDDVGDADKMNKPPTIGVVKRLKREHEYPISCSFCIITQILEFANELFVSCLCIYQSGRNHHQ